MSLQTPLGGLCVLDVHTEGEGEGELPVCFKLLVDRDGVAPLENEQHFGCVWCPFSEMKPSV